MSYAFLIVAECKRGNTAEAQVQVQKLAQLVPGFGPGTLAGLFDVFPPPLRAKSLAYLRDAGLNSAGAVVDGRIGLTTGYRVRVALSQPQRFYLVSRWAVVTYHRAGCPFSVAASAAWRPSSTR